MYDPTDGHLIDLPFVLRDGTSAKMVDGFAAGHAWFKFLILDGPHRGKSIWCDLTEDELFRYDARVSEDDCERFNDPTSDVGGSIIPEWDGMEFAVVELF